MIDEFNIGLLGFILGYLSRGLIAILWARSKNAVQELREYRHRWGYD